METIGDDSFLLSILQNNEYVSLRDLRIKYGMFNPHCAVLSLKMCGHKVKIINKEINGNKTQVCRLYDIV